MRGFAQTFLPALPSCGAIIGPVLVLCSAWMAQANCFNSMNRMTWCTSEEGSDRDSKLCLTRAIWNGAATGNGVFKLIVESTKDIGGFHVVRVS